MEANGGASTFNAARLSCSDSAFPRLSHKAALAVIRDLGFGAVDIGVLAGYRHTPPAFVIDSPIRAADEVIRRLEPTGLVVADVFLILGDPFETLAINHPDPQMRTESLRQFQQVVQFARRLAPPGLTLLPGTPFDGISPDQSLELAAVELQRRAEIAAQAGMALSIEPHYQSIVETPTRVLQLLEQAPDVTLTLDYSHFVFQGIPQADVDVLIPRSRHLQLRQAAPGDMQARTREGTIDFTLMVNRLASAGYTGYFGHEYCWEEWMGINDVDCVSETAELRDLLLEAFDRLPSP